MCRFHAKVTDFNVGSASPVIHRVTTALDEQGNLQALDCDAYLHHDDMLLGLEADTPLGTGRLKVLLLRL
jgi:hypothetical protein